MNEKDFRKSLYTGKLLGHLVTLKYGDESQSVIAKAVQFDPVSDRPLHFDLMRVDMKQIIKIEVPVHFINLANHKLGDSIRISDIKLPKGVEPSISDRDFMIAAIKVSSAAMSEAADQAADEAAEAEAESVEVPATAQGDDVEAAGEGDKSED